MDLNVDPIVTLSAKLTKATPFDHLYLVTMRNYSAWCHRVKVNESSYVEMRQVSPLMLTTKNSRQWKFEASKSTQPTCHEFTICQFNPTDICDHWKFEVAMAVVDPNGNLVELSNWQSVEDANQPQLFHFNQWKLDKLATNGELKLFVWISQVPSDKLSEEEFQQEYQCWKAEFLAMQTATKSDLFSANRYKCYAQHHRIQLQTFECLFDSPWLPTYFKYGLDNLNRDVEIFNSSTLKIHHYDDWIKSNSPFQEIIKLAGVYEWLLTITPVADAQVEVTLQLLTSVNVAVGRFWFRFRMKNGKKCGQHEVLDPSESGVTRFTFGRNVVDQFVVNNFCEIEVLVNDKYDTEFTILSCERVPLEFSAKMFVGSEFVQTKLNRYSRLHGGNATMFPVHFHTHFPTYVLVRLRWVLLFGIDSVAELQMEPPIYREYLENVYFAADYFLLIELKDIIQSILGYQPQPPVPIVYLPQIGYRIASRRGKKSRRFTCRSRFTP